MNKIYLTLTSSLTERGEIFIKYCYIWWWFLPFSTVNAMHRDIMKHTWTGIFISSK